MLKHLVPVISGILFGLGLAVSGMTNTDKVQGFWDIFGQWQFELALVMASALATFGIGYRIIIKRDKPILSSSFHIPKTTLIDKRLIFGSALFGTGWGLVGYCPGPAIASFSYGYWQPAVFVVALIFGSIITKRLDR